MPALPRHLLETLDDPWLVATGGVVLVLAVRGAQLPLGAGLLLGIGVTYTLSRWRRDRRDREQRRRDGRLETRFDSIEERCQQLAAHGRDLLRQAALVLQSEEQLNLLAEVQMLGDRLIALPAWSERHAEALEAGRGVPLPLQSLRQQLRREEQALRQESAGRLKQERQQLVAQLRSNLDSAERGLDEREARIVALATALERLAGGLQRLQQLMERSTGRASPAASTELNAAVQSLQRSLAGIEAMGQEPLA